MSVRIHCRHPLGFEMWVDAQSIDAADTLCRQLVNAGYRPVQAAGDQYQRTPTGEPICSKHGMAMNKRERQGDTWYSHAVSRSDGEVLYCRGYPHGPQEKDGYAL